MEYRRIHDISLPLDETLVTWPGDPSFELNYTSHIAQGDHATVSFIRMCAHSGTHVDAPAHFIAGGKGVDALDLEALIGKAIVIETGDMDQLRERELRTLHIPPGIKRILFHTKNSSLWSRKEKNFSRDYVGITSDGARYLVSLGVLLVGIDYLSVAPFDETGPTHQILLDAGVIPLEGLNLSGIKGGIYTLLCLPLNISGGDGAPARVVLLES